MSSFSYVACHISRQSKCTFRGLQQDCSCRCNVHDKSYCPHAEVRIRYCWLVITFVTLNYAVRPCGLETWPVFFFIGGIRAQNASHIFFFLLETVRSVKRSFFTPFRKQQWNCQCIFFGSFPWRPKLSSCQALQWNSVILTSSYNIIVTAKPCICIHRFDMYTCLSVCDVTSQANSRWPTKFDKVTFDKSTGLRIDK